jgi:hypothetical protein
MRAINTVSIRKDTRKITVRCPDERSTHAYTYFLSGVDWFGLLVVSGRLTGRIFIDSPQ